MERAKVYTMRLSDRCDGRDNNFNLIRMAASCGVLISHAFPLSYGANEPEPFESLLKGDNLGRACVFCFFAISGFFISRSFARKPALSEFVTARILRLFPALGVMLLVMIAAGSLVTAAPIGLYWLRAPLYALNTFALGFAHDLPFLRENASLPGMFLSNPVPNAFNGALWSLRFEVLCYVGVVVAGVLGVLSDKRKMVCVLAICGIGYAFRIEAIREAWPLPYVPSMLTYVGLPFVIGMSFWIWRDRIVLSWRIAAALVGIAALLWPTPAFQPAFVGALAYGVFVVGYADIEALRPYRTIGDYSYGMYIYAFPVQQFVASLGAKTPVLNVMTAFPIALFCAILSWHAVERPALGLRAGHRSDGPAPRPA